MRCHNFKRTYLAEKIIVAVIDINRMNPTCDADELVAAEIIDDQYTYHPWDPAQTNAGDAVRDALSDAALAIVVHVPASPDRSAALRKLREARMDANSAITHNGKY